MKTRMKAVISLVVAFLLGVGAFWGAQAGYRASVGAAYQAGMMEGVNRVMSTLGQELQRSGSVIVPLQRDGKQEQVKLVLAPKEK